ncbi:hypothetical protein [Herbaspirillum rhizosphaerae]|uniref:hypothetical protein n=1 Tax=Herbaspirillum rhizosphaerae TaxID=346179 RepID=UPI00067DC930|nr:hypothetical protein [Herbaspirillum rhizosphaerae]
MTEQTDFFITAWKHMAELDDFLAEQAAEAARRITERFAWKRERCAISAAQNDFRLEVIVRKESVVTREQTTCVCAMLNLSLLTASATASRESYLHAVELLREATNEAMALPPALTRIGVRFRWERKYRYCASRPTQLQSGSE